MKAISGTSFKARLAVVILSLIAQTVQAESSTVDASPNLILGGPVFPTGWMYLDNGSVGGQRPEFFDKVARHAGFSWQGQLFPAKRLMSNLLQGHVEITMLVQNPLLDQPNLILSGEEAIYTENLNIYGKSGSAPVRYRSDLMGKKIVVMRGYGYGGFKRWLDDPDNRVQQFEVDSFQQAISVLIERQQDYALLYDLNLEAGLKALSKDGDHAASKQAKQFTVTKWAKVPVYFHLSKRALPDAQAVLDKLMNSVHELQDEGVLPLVELQEMPGDQGTLN
ncbi:hypothetical protein [Allohahella marinimesophila]|uniref:Polar amino acid transport system substrate-binding protein n=1 Tax=Allohahella marinimesophila TaxID=1054972 RepID=A0ABP7NRI8_9GAMM